MALVSPTGFNEDVDEAAFQALMADHGLLYSYGRSLSSMRPTIGGTGDRPVTIAPGVATGKGHRIVNDDDVVINHTSVGSGSRWDMCVIRRNYSTDSVTFAVIEGGTTKALPSRTEGAPIDEQPLYLARVEAGKSTVQELVDLRSFVNAGGALALDELALSYLKFPGASIMVKGLTWNCYEFSGVLQWESTRSSVSPITLFGVGGALLNGPAPKSGLLLQAGTTVGTTDAAGYSRVTFPTPFPSGLLTVVISGGDSSAHNLAGEILQYSVAGHPWNIGTKEYFAYAVERPRATWPNLKTGGVIHRLNWLAIGW